MANHRVAVLALDCVITMDLSIPAQIFTDREQTPYRMQLCGRSPGPVRTTSGFPVIAQRGLAALRYADTVVVPGFSPHDAPLPGDVLDALRGAYARGTRMVSICTGAFALAAAGILDGHSATTHWRYADDLAARYPRISVEAGVLYVDAGRVLTSAGVACGIDLCLHIVRNDFGTAVANRVARDIVAAPHRGGGQAQYVERCVPPERGTTLAGTRAWALHNLHRALLVADLARHANLSERTLARRFVAETGMPPLQWLLAARVDLARELLERGDLSVEQVADLSGLGSAANLRLHFRRLVGTSPGAYRKTFA